MAYTAIETLNALTGTFFKIGGTEDTIFNDLNKKEASAHEFIVASTLRRVANKRYELAERDALRDGIIGEDSLIKGQTMTVWKPKKTPVKVIVTGSMSHDPQPMIDKEMLMQTLIEHVGVSKANQILSKSLKPVKPSVTYGVVVFS